MATITTTAVQSSAAVASSSSAGPASLLVVAAPTLTACSQYGFQWRFANVANAGLYSMTINAANIGVAQSIIPSGSSASLPAITSVRSSVRAVNPLSVTSGLTFPPSSSATAPSSSTAITTASVATSPRAGAATTSATPSSAPASATSRTAVAARKLPDSIAARGMARRSEIPINGTIGTGPANVAYEWSGSLPEGNYLITYNIPGLGLSASQQVTVVEPSSGDLSCLSPWRALSAQLSDAQTSSTARSTASSRPSGSLADSNSGSGGNSSSTPTGMIAGIVVGVVGGLAIIALLAFCFVRRKRQRRENLYNDFDYHKNDRDRVNLDEFRGEKLGSAGGSPEAAWGTGVGTSSSRGHGYGAGEESSFAADAAAAGGGAGRDGRQGMMPVPLGMIPRSERGSIDSISAKSVDMGDSRADYPHGAATGRASGSSESHNATVYPPINSGMPQLPPIAVLNATPNRSDPFSSRSGSATPRTPSRTHAQGQAQRYDDGRRQSSPPISPSGYTAAMSQPFGSTGTYPDFNPDAVNQAFANRSVGDRSSGVASDALTGRRPSAPSAYGQGQGVPTAMQGAEPVQRKGSVKRKPVPSLGPALRKELSEGQALGSKSRQGSVGSMGSSGAAGVAAGQFAKMEAMLGRSGSMGSMSGQQAGVTAGGRPGERQAEVEGAGRKEYVIMPDPPRGQ